jgi:hypothetical protein
VSTRADRTLSDVGAVLRPSKEVVFMAAGTDMIPADTFASSLHLISSDGGECVSQKRRLA